MSLETDVQRIVRAALKAAQPDTAVEKALAVVRFPDRGRVLLVAAGKAAWQMAKTACALLGGRVDEGVVITKYGHAQGSLPRVRVFEAGHPVPDANSFAATAEALRLVSGLGKDDRVLFLLSGGGSALFEQPLIPGEELRGITGQLLACGADIVEINTIRKRLSAVKGGRFAQLCAPARVEAIVLSDIIGDPLDMIASGPAYPDSSTCAQALAIAEKYGLRLSAEAAACLRRETPKSLQNVSSQVTGSVRQLCEAARTACGELGYAATVLTASLSCQAREAGSFLGSIAEHHQDAKRSLAFIAGGETVVRLTGKGKGGRNQELALAAAAKIGGFPGTAVFSLGSDGTDGPTDAAGGFADGNTAPRLKALGIDISRVLDDNDAYHALKETDGLIITGPTGTNVNDLSVLLIRRQEEGPGFPV